jgi:hypothetical protein
MLIRLHPFFEADKGDNGNDPAHEQPPTEKEPPPEPPDVDTECDKYIGELIDYIEQQRATIEQLTARIDEHERNGHANPAPELDSGTEPEPEESHWYFKHIGKKG